MNLGAKIPQQNTSKPNLAEYKEDYMSWQSRISPKNWNWISSKLKTLCYKWYHQETEKTIQRMGENV